MNIQEIRRNNMNIGRLESNKTNILKGCLSYVEKKQSKQDKIYNNLIKTLIEKPKIYNDIYNKWSLYLDERYEEGKENHIFEYLNDKEFNIIDLLEYRNPKEINEDLLR